jgi:hypothetical protein
LRLSPSDDPLFADDTARDHIIDRLGQVERGTTPTSIHQVSRQEIREMVKKLMSLLMGDNIRPETTILSVFLAVRDSA